MKPTLLFPDAIAIVDQAEIQDETFANISELLTNGFIDFDLGEEAVSLTKGFESFESEVLRPGGMVKVDSHVVRRMAQLALTFGSWQHKINALNEGIHPDDVVANAKAKFAVDEETAADGTAITTAVVPESVYNQEFSILVRCPLRRSTGSLYIFIPKCVVKQDATEQTIRLGAQQKPVVSFEALALQTSELAAHQAIFDKVSASGLAYIFSGEADA